jgi:hypothetical protein
VWNPQYSLVWENQIPSDSRKALAEQRKLSSYTQGKIEDMPPSLNTTTSSKPTYMSDRVISVSPEVSPKPSGSATKSHGADSDLPVLIKRQREPATYQEMQGLTSRSADTKRIKQDPDQYTATLNKETIADLAEILHSIAVVDEEKLSKAEVSKKKAAPLKILISIDKPTQIEQTLWNLTQNKVRGIAQSRPVSVAEEVLRAIGITILDDILKAMI